MDESSDDDCKNQDRHHIGAQRIVDEVVPQQAIRKEWEHIVEAEKRPSA